VRGGGERRCSHIAQSLIGLVIFFLVAPEGGKKKREKKDRGATPGTAAGVSSVQLEQGQTRTEKKKERKRAAFCRRFFTPPVCMGFRPQSASTFNMEGEGGGGRERKRLLEKSVSSVLSSWRTL